MAFLEGILPKSMLERAAPALAGKGRLTLLAGAAVIATVICLAYLWSGSSGYAVLYAGLSGEEGGRAITELQKLAIPYQISQGGRVIMVPAADAGRARLLLAARGIPKQGGDEWSLLDNESLGVSPFVEQVHYVRGIEAALSRTVGEVDGVISAKVTLALPKPSDFLADAPKPSASVMVRLSPGLTLSDAQVRGIVGLVASSVPGLTPDNVTVIDQTGRVLNPGHGDGLQQIPEQLDIAHEIDARYETVITDLVAPIFGRGNFRVSVDANIDFSQSKESSIKYGASHVLSQDATIHAILPGADAPAGIPGALSNEPPGNPSAPATVKPKPPTPAATATPATPDAALSAVKPDKVAAAPADSHTTTNYDIDRTVQFLQNPPWKLRSLNVAVLVNNPTGKPIPAERIKTVKMLVTSAIGVGQNREVTVVDLPFDQESAAPAPGTVPPWWKAPWMHVVEENSILAIAGLLALFGGLFPMLRRLSGSYAAVAGGFAATAATGGRGAGAIEPQAALASGEAATTPPPSPPPSPPLAAALAGISQDVLRTDTETVRLLVANDPARTAQVIKEWLSRDGNNAKRSR